MRAVKERRSRLEKVAKRKQISQGWSLSEVGNGDLRAEIWFLICAHQCCLSDFNTCRPSVTLSLFTLSSATWVLTALRISCVPNVVCVTLSKLQTRLVAQQRKVVHPHLPSSGSGSLLDLLSDHVDWRVTLVSLRIGTWKSEETMNSHLHVVSPVSINQT